MPVYYTNAKCMYRPTCSQIGVGLHAMYMAAICIKQTVIVQHRHNTTQPYMSANLPDSDNALYHIIAPCHRCPYVDLHLYIIRKVTRINLTYKKAEKIFNISFVIYIYISINYSFCILYGYENTRISFI